MLSTAGGRIATLLQKKNSTAYNFLLRSARARLVEWPLFYSASPAVCEDAALGEGVLGQLFAVALSETRAEPGHPMAAVHLMAAY